MSINLLSLSKKIIEKPFYVYKPEVLKRTILNFRKKFNGKTIYAIKANPSSFILKQLLKNGINSFDVASLNEVRIIKKICSNTNLYFMNPIKSRKSISDSYFKYGVKNFALDSEAELKKILEQTKFAKDLNLHLRISIPNTYARLKIEKKFGVEPSLSDKLLRKLFFYAKKIGICFHVGSQCVSPQAYRIGLKISKRLIEKATYKIDYLNVGGGFPVVYSPRKKNILNNYFSVINEEFSKIKNYQKISLLSEPGRCLVADCLSLIVRVELRKSQKLYINEGVHGFLYSAGTNNFSYVVKMINKKRKKINKYLPFSFYGPTCDANDFMKGPFILPDSIEEGDYIEIFQMGAYSQTFQTDFNGFGYSGEINIINYNDLKKVKI